METQVLEYAQKSEEVEDIEGQDEPFGQEELERVRKGLPNGKATGVDGLPNEVLKNGGPAMAASIQALFNWIRKAERLPTRWLRGMIATIYKDGPKEDPGNYRGITLLCHVGKYFSTAIAKRVYRTLEQGDHICEEQGGFREKRSTIDQAFVLHECLMRRKHAGQNSYCFFLDVRKAFGTVWQNGLWKNMFEAGIQGKLWRLVRALYRDTESCVLVDGEHTRWFGKGNRSQGVRQGCPLSTALFALFVDGRRGPAGPRPRCQSGSSQLSVTPVRGRCRHRSKHTRGTAEHDRNGG